LLVGKKDFGFETTLSTRSYVSLVKSAKKPGYNVVLIYFWLESSDLAKARVKVRVEKGGHGIPQIVIERRYLRGLHNFFTMYMELCNSWIVYDNSHEVPVIIASGSSNLVNHIYNNHLWGKLRIEK
jgi:predicted ABC-type ATPase